MTEDKKRQFELIELQIAYCTILQDKNLPEQLRKDIEKYTTVLADENMKLITKNNSFALIKTMAV